MIEPRWRNFARAAIALSALATAACGSGETSGPSASATATAAQTAVAPAHSASAAPSDDAGVGELRDFKIFPEGPVKGHHFVAEIGIAKGPVVKDPMFRVLFKDESGATVDTGSCAYRGVIKPEDHVPCYGAIWKVPKWAKYEIVTVAPQDIVPAESAPLVVSDTSLTANKNQVDGKVTNTGKTAIKNVTAYVSFFGADGKIVGGSSADLAEKELAPGASAKFTVTADDVAAPPKTFYVKMSP